MTSSDPYRTTSSADDRTWRISPRSKALYAIGPIILVVFALTALSIVRGGGTVTVWGGSWFLWVFAAVFVYAVVSALVETLRTAYRITLRRDGTLEMTRPIGTARIRIDQVRAMRVSRFEDRGRGAIRMLTDQGTYRVHRGLEDLDGMVEVLRERNPRIELPSIQ